MQQQNPVKCSRLIYLSFFSTSSGKTGNKDTGIAPVGYARITATELGTISIAFLHAFFSTIGSKRSELVRKVGGIATCAGELIRWRGQID